MPITDASPMRARIVVFLGDTVALERAPGMLASYGHQVDATADAVTLQQLVERPGTDMVLLPLGPRDEVGVKILREVRRRAPQAALLVAIPEGEVDTIVEAIKAGADHCLSVPLRDAALAALTPRALDKPRLIRQAAQAQQMASTRLDAARFARVIGSHPVMQRLLNKTYQAAKSRATVLICGETGTGKELVAAALHLNSPRAEGPFVRLNCASLAESVLESELFGHERGAFTGATALRRGRFEQAHGGTLFLDEVSEVPLSTQVKLLRFLQERELERVGGDRTLRVDVRVVAATNRDLAAMVKDKQFREDLFYRLNVVRLEVPPLRARPSDILLIAEHYLALYAAENEQPAMRLTQAAREALLTYPFPGNVRELQNMIEQAVVLSEGEEVDIDALPIAPRSHADVPLQLLVPGITLAELERFAIMRTLEAVGGSPSRAAAILGVSRRTIQYRMRQWGLMGGKGWNSNGA